DLVTKHGKRVTVIVTGILSGDVLPVIIKDGMDPTGKFYTIVALALPYTASLIAAFFALALCAALLEKIPPVLFAIIVIIIFVFFGWLCSSLHLGITHAEFDNLVQRGEDVGHEGPIVAFNHFVYVFFSFYFHKYGIALFIGATLAAVVIIW